MNEFEEAKLLANKILETPYKDPDDDESVLARQFLRQVEKVKLLRRVIGNALDIIGTGTDCQCQGESCSWCDLRQLLGRSLSDNTEDYEALMQDLEKRRKVFREAKGLQEKVDHLNKQLASLYQEQGMDDLIQANRDEILRKHQEAVRLIAPLLIMGGSGPETMTKKIAHVGEILHALNSFHPMHAESWQGWPKGEV